jgi:hypothetical protein
VGRLFKAEDPLWKKECTVFFRLQRILVIRWVMMYWNSVESMLSLFSVLFAVKALVGHAEMPPNSCFHNNFT